MRRSCRSRGSWSSNCRSKGPEAFRGRSAMPVTQAEHDRRLKAPAVCELLALRDLPLGDNIMVRTNGAFVAGYKLREILTYFATDSDRGRGGAGGGARGRGGPGGGGRGRRRGGGAGRRGGRL